MAQTSFKVVIGPVRFSYLHVFEPYAFEADKDPQYSATLLIPKSDKKLVAEIEAAIANAYKAAVEEKWGGKKPPMKNATCLYDGDEPNKQGDDRGEAYHDCFFLNAKSRQQPDVVGRDRRPILDSNEVYSGCWGYASIAFSGYSNNGNMGISCFLNHIMKTKDGEPLGGTRTSAVDDFAGIELDELEDL